MRSLENVIHYINGKTKYGSENLCYLLYSLVKMEQPDVVVELGIGAGVTTCMIAQALKENGKGMIWGIDNGEDWTEGSYDEFLNKLLNQLELNEVVNFKNITLTETEFFDPKKPIDILFADVGNTGPLECINLLRYYLPKMNKYSSIFIDRSSTIHHAYLLLEQIIKYFQEKKIPACLTSALVEEDENIPKCFTTSLTKEDTDKLYKLVLNSKFTLMHLTETQKAKKIKHQNSTAWIKIEPLDLFHHNGVQMWAEHQQKGKQDEK